MLVSAGRRVTCNVNLHRTCFARSALRYLTDDAATHKDIPPHVEDVKTHPIKTPITDLLAKHAALEKSIKRRISALTARATRLRREQERAKATEPEPVPRIARPALQPHQDLASFLDYAEEYNLKTTSTVFKGTLFEYTVAEALKAYDMSLNRVGKANDHGIDLLGHWSLPDSPALRVLVQCKMTKPVPAFIRELEGSYVGAPSGWQGDNVLALLTSRYAASPGTQQAIQRSKWPLGFLQINTEGVVRQFIWNATAIDCGLSGVGVASRYATTTDTPAVETSIALTWLGDPWPSKPQQQD